MKSSTPGGVSPRSEDKKGSSAVERAFSLLEKEYVVVGKTHVNSWHAWLAIGIFAGVVLAIALISNQSGQFEESSAAFGTPAYPFALVIDNVVTQGQAVSIYWQNPGVTYARDWIAMVPVGGKFVNQQVTPWIYTNGLHIGTGTLQTSSVMAPGMYELVYYINNGFTIKGKGLTFSVVVPRTIPSIKVLSPNGGERYQQATGLTVKWSLNYNPTGALRILLTDSNTGKEYYSEIVPGFTERGLSPEATNIPAGSYRFTICDENAPICDSSDAPFRIVAAPGGITMIPVAGGIYPGDAIRVDWTNPGTPSSSGKDWIAMVQPGAKFENKEKHPWFYMGTTKSGSGILRTTSSTVPGTYELRYYINNGFTIKAKGPTFTVAAPETIPSIKILSPNGGETVTAGTPYVIRWQATNYSSSASVQIQLRRRAANGGPPELVQTIASATANDGSEPWIPALPAATSDSYYIDITCAGVFTVCGGDLSDTPFVIRSYPTLTRLSVPSNTLTNGTMALYRFSITAPVVGDIGLYKFTFNVPLSPAATISNLSVRSYFDSAFSLGADAESILFDQATKTARTGGMRIPAGATRYFELRGTVANATSGASVQVSLLGDSQYSNSGQAAVAPGNFIWSPNPSPTTSLTTNDWLNGYLVSGLSSTAMTPQVFSR